MDGVERSHDPGIEDARGIEQGVVEPDEVQPAQNLARSPQRRGSEMANGPRHLGAGERARDAARMGAQEAP